MFSIALSSIATARYVGCELGDLEAWDDVVIEKENGDLSHFQVKRQLVAFSKDAAKRDTISKGPRLGQYRDPSELDKAMASLATHFDPNASARSTERRFFIVCPASVEVKEGLTLAHLADLCSESRKAGVTATSMAARADTPTTAVFDWLTTWCGFRDWGHILCALKSLSIEYVGEESSIHQSTDQILAEWFIDAPAARAQIYGFLQENSSDVGAPSPRQILY